MLTKTSHLEGIIIKASDGELGTVEQLYFDDQSWAIRYLTVDTGGWLGGRRVLISPLSIVRTDFAANQIVVKLTQAQVKNSPDIDTHKPVSRQHEMAFLGYYGYPNYWDSPFGWGAGFYPGAMAAPILVRARPATGATGDSQDSHLRSTSEVKGYDIEASDGDIGHVAGFIIDDQTWSIRYIEASTRNWWPGKKVLFAPEWIEKITWSDSTLSVRLLRESIKNAPEYIESVPLTREYEARLYFHYGRSPYWAPDSEPPSAGSGDIWSPDHIALPG